MRSILIFVSVLILTFNVFTFGEILNIKIEDHEPFWARSNETEFDIPESAVFDVVEPTTILNSFSSVEVTTDNTGIVDDFGVRQEFAQNPNSEDLSSSYTPGYCRCINKYYCSGPNFQVVRAKRAINTPPCRNRDEVMCCLTSGPGCGVPAQFPYFNPYPLYGEANFGDHPWTALVMDTNNQVIYGIGIVVSWKIVLTTARNVQNLPIGRSNKLKVRLGEWDLSTNDEPFKPKDYYISEVIIHPGFNPKTYQNDIAILKLSTTVDLSSFPSIRSACIAQPNDNQKFNLAKCLVAGWGTQASLTKITTGSKQPEIPRNILKEVDMQILDGPLCQEALRRNIGDSQFLLDQRSFLCAGGEAGKGLCKGDEGAALICKDQRSSRYTVVGMSSWGTTCGQSGFPSVFTNMASYYDWIKSVDPNLGQ